MEITTENLASNSEHWASIDGYTNNQVSWWGRVRNVKTARILKGGLASNGYTSVNLCKKGIKPKTHFIHQLVAHEWVNNSDGKACVVHIDGCRTNNHHENLRWASHSENSRNMKKHIDGSSVYKGVSFHKSSNKWNARIMIQGKAMSLGLFKIEKEAAEAYNAAAAKFYKNFARLNDLD